MNQLISFEPICYPSECPPTPAAASSAELLESPHSGQQLIDLSPRSGPLAAHH